MKALLRPSVTVLFVMTLLLGVAYPLAVTGLAQLLFPHQANGSLLLRGGRPAGSALVGQFFDDPRYFRGRPSATGPIPYNAAASGGSNLGPSNPALVKVIRERIDALRWADPGQQEAIPVDLVTASASGLDPHISPAAALYQVSRVARARGLDEETVRQMVLARVRKRELGILGEPVVPVLELNMAMDARR
ncbi:MAG: potassium-transporting ATPase subunit KdpC [Syntrophaceae bacterium]|nr:potassium-transporting ATPase subunit KdpC [Syntrophaceae bacterium]